MGCTDKALSCGLSSTAHLPVCLLHPLFYLQHGERAVRTPFAPLGFMPIVPDATAPAAPASVADTAEATTDTFEPAEAATATAEEEEVVPMDTVPEYPDAPEGTSSVVTLVFPEAVCPERLVFVLHQLGPDMWVRDHGE